MYSYRSSAIWLAAAVALAAILIVALSQRPSKEPTKPEQTQTEVSIAKLAENVAQDLEVPWEVAFLPANELRVTERPGRLLKIGKDRQAIPIEAVQHVGEGGLLGLALHPDFGKNQLIYLYLTTKTGEGLTNRVERYRLDGSKVADRKVLLENIPGAAFHDGGRMAFGPDKKLYITTGDASNKPLAQDKNSLAGKILRLNDDGSIPNDNPFGNAVWSYGHRNPQGIAWDNKERLWATEHGAKAHDEINLIERGANYGWPDIQGDQTKNGMVKPVLHSGATTTWAPSGLAFLDGKLYFSGLVSETLFEIAVNQDGTLGELKTHLKGEYGRLRAAVAGPEGKLYISTSNRDGRGNPKQADDKVIRVEIKNLGL